MSELSITIPKKLRALLASAGLMVLFAFNACAPSRELELDLILVSIDTLRADRLGIYAADRSPEGDSRSKFTIPWLAEQGTTWENCWSSAGKTVPSLGSFFTGLEPLEHGAFSHLTPVQAPSLISQLKAKGYRTIGRAANRLLGSELGFDRGFDDYGIRPREYEPRVASELLDLSQSSINEDKPLLMWAHFMAPHQPYEPPGRYDRWSRPECRVVADNSLLNRLHRNPNGLDRELLADIQNRYDGEVAYASDMLRGLLAGLDRQYQEAGRGTLLENAVVVFFSDHGEELGDRNAYFMHAKSLYSGVVRVPLVIAGPGFASNQRAATIALQDLLPMVMQRMKLSDQQARPAREFYVSSWMRDYYSLRNEQWTLVHSPSPDRGLGPKEPPPGVYAYPSVALFDRQQDPLEKRDVAAQNPEVVQQLQNQLCDWFGALKIVEPKFLSGVNPEMLEELGYAEIVEDQKLSPQRPK